MNESTSQPTRVDYTGKTVRCNYGKRYGTIGTVISHDICRQMVSVLWDGGKKTTLHISRIYQIPQA